MKPLSHLRSVLLLLRCYPGPPACPQTSRNHHHHHPQQRRGRRRRRRRRHGNRYRRRWRPRVLRWLPSATERRRVRQALAPRMDLYQAALAPRMDLIGSNYLQRVVRRLRHTTHIPNRWMRSKFHGGFAKPGSGPSHKKAFMDDDKLRKTAILSRF
jgi:hypothetical protein|eukprot:COSAG06_NODE_2711_length_6401_cov_343.215192_5_plen_156_part_00